MKSRRNKPNLWNWKIVHQCKILVRQTALSLFTCPSPSPGATCADGYLPWTLFAPFPVEPDGFSVRWVWNRQHWPPSKWPSANRSRKTRWIVPLKCGGPGNDAFRKINTQCLRASFTHQLTFEVATHQTETRLQTGRHPWTTVHHECEQDHERRYAPGVCTVHQKLAGLVQLVDALYTSDECNKTPLSVRICGMDVRCVCERVPPKLLYQQKLQNVRVFCNEAYEYKTNSV